MIRQRSGSTHKMERESGDPRIVLKYCTGLLSRKERAHNRNVHDMGDTSGKKYNITLKEDSQ